MRSPPVGEQRVGLIEHQERLRGARFAERRGDLMLRSAHEGGQQVGGALVEHRHAEPPGEVAYVGALAGTGRTLQAQRQPARTAAGDLIGELHRVGVGTDQRRVVPLRRLRFVRSGGVGQHASQVVDTAPHRLDVAPDQGRTADRPFRHPGRYRELRGQGGGGTGLGHDVVPVKLPLPDPGAHRSRRQAQFQRIHHAPQNDRIHRPDVVHDPDRRHRRLLQQPVQKHLRSLAAACPGGKHR